jgi:hypothetical protein
LREQTKIGFLTQTVLYCRKKSTFGSSADNDLLEFKFYNFFEDAEGSPIKGIFYEQGLQKTSYPDVYLVEKIIDPKPKWYS